MEPSPQCQYEALPRVFPCSLALVFFSAFSDLAMSTAFSTVHPPILFHQAGAGPVSALSLCGTASVEPTLRISRGDVGAGKSQKQKLHLVNEAAQRCKNNLDVPLNSFLQTWGLQLLTLSHLAPFFPDKI